MTHMLLQIHFYFCHKIVNDPSVRLMGPATALERQSFGDIQLSSNNISYPASFHIHQLPKKKHFKQPTPKKRTPKLVFQKFLPPSRYIIRKTFS